MLRPSPCCGCSWPTAGHRAQLPCEITGCVELGWGRRQIALSSVSPCGTRRAAPAAPRTEPYGRVAVFLDIAPETDGTSSDTLTVAKVRRTTRFH